MNQTEIGKFIAKCRKEKNLTQAQLAEKLNITDRAVSKWETGKSMPDSSIMLELCEILGIMVCLICNIAISGNLTWSLIPVSSIVFAWVISFPSIVLGKRGIIVSIISLSVFIIPYLFLLSSLIKVKEVFSVGAVMAVASIVFLWIIVAFFSRIGKEKKLIALGITFLSAIPFVFIVNAVLAKMIAEPIFDVWDMLSVFILLILAFVSFIIDYAKKKGLIK